MQQDIKSETLVKPVTKTAKVSKKIRRGKKAKSAFRTISEVASGLGVQQHVLRFWEGKFTQVKPLKRGGGRRYYRPEDVQLLEKIHHLLYSEGYTIRGVQKLLKSTRGSVSALDKKVESASSTEIIELAESVVAVEETVTKEPKETAKTVRIEMLKIMLDELKSMRQLIEV